MTYAEIKTEALKLMFAGADEVLYAQNIEIYEQDEKYRDYLAAMPGAINRALWCIEKKMVLPVKRRKLCLDDAEVSGAFVRYAPDFLLNDYYETERLVMETRDGYYDGDHDFILEGNEIVLPRYDEGDGIAYTLIYYPKAARVSDATPNTFRLDIPEGIAAYIPYFIKGDLFRADEPNEASEAHNLFEAALEEIRERTVSKQTSVSTLYSQV